MLLVRDESARLDNARPLERHPAVIKEVHQARWDTLADWRDGEIPFRRSNVTYGVRALPVTW